MHSKPMVRTALACAAALAVAAIWNCGGSSDGPTPVPSPTPIVIASPSPTPTPGVVLPQGMVCNPTPPPLFRLHVSAKAKDGARWQFDSKPVVRNVDDYCGRVGFSSSSKYCDTRPEGDLQRVACDYMAIGKAKDTQRWGPTWYYEGKLCTDDSVCKNHDTEQFLFVGKKPGEYRACAADNVPIDPESELVYGRCGIHIYE